MSTKPFDDRRLAISVIERKRRQCAVNFARASIGLEGFVPSDACEDRARCFISGEIDIVEFVRVSAK